MTVPFEKWQALGNDYVIVEADRLPFELTAARVRALCAAHTGIGADGVLELSRTEDPDHVARLRIFNPDGSEAELSGNGAREAILYLRRAGWTDAEEFTVLTVAGEIRPRVLDGHRCTVAMGRASLRSAAYPSGGAEGTGELRSAGRTFAFQHVSIGNPQCVIDVGEEVEQLDLAAYGPPIEAHELFPQRTNVSFVRVDGDRVRARIYERGVGETLSSGTGASGAAVLAHLRGARSPITVQLDGGELQVDVSDQLDISLTGWAVPVYRGELSRELTTTLEEA